MRHSRTLVLFAILAVGMLAGRSAFAQTSELNTLWFTPNMTFEFGNTFTGGTVGGTVTYDRLLNDRLGLQLSAGGTFTQHTSATATTRTGTLSVGAGLSVRPIALLHSLAVRPSVTVALDPMVASPRFVPGGAVDVAWTPLWSSLVPGQLMVSAGLGANYAESLAFHPRLGISFGVRF